VRERETADGSAFSLPDGMGRIAVLGAGSWGTALAWLLGRTGATVALWCRESARAAEMQAARLNARYLPGTALPDTVSVTAEMSCAIGRAAVVVVAVPAQAVREVLGRGRDELGSGVPLILAAKGLERETGLRLSQVAAEVLPPGHAVAVLSGPNLSGELVREIPSTTVIAATDERLARSAQGLFATPFLRVYTNADVTGVELGGALKNIVALGAGISDGLGFGDNTKAALVTRGLAEMVRLGVACGARAETFVGLSGLGDLVATCSSGLSRNHALGVRLGRGELLPAALSALGHVAEGVPTTVAARRLSRQYGVEMPITAEIHRVLYEGRSPREAVAALMCRAFRDE
jgi:glycerol-3-phosphate dehydrogenase (NAD(P)+)